MALSQSHARNDKSAYVQGRPNYHIDEFSTGADPALGSWGTGLLARKELRSKKRQLPKTEPPAPRAQRAPVPSSHPLSLPSCEQPGMPAALPWRRSRQPGVAADLWGFLGRSWADLGPTLGRPWADLGRPWATLDGPGGHGTAWGGSAATTSMGCQSLPRGRRKLRRGICALARSVGTIARPIVGPNVGPMACGVVPG
jgi:hypothetical protein